MPAGHGVAESRHEDDLDPEPGLELPRDIHPAVAMPQVHVDECDVDLRVARGGKGFPERPGHAGATVSPIMKVARGLQRDQRRVFDDADAESGGENARASCRERVCEIVEVWGGGVAKKKK